MPQVADWIVRVLDHIDDPSIRVGIADEVRQFLAQFPYNH